MSDISLDKITTSDPASPSTSTPNHDVTQEKPSGRRSTLTTPMLEFKKNPKQHIDQHVYRANSAINKLASGTRVISPKSEKLNLSFAPHTQAALGINANTITPEAETMIHTAIQETEQNQSI